MNKELIDRKDKANSIKVELETEKNRTQALEAKNKELMAEMGNLRKDRAAEKKSNDLLDKAYVPYSIGYAV